MTQELISNVESNMKTSVNHLVEEFTKIRTGRANPSLVSNIQVDYYGTKTPLQQLASISVPDPKLLLIQPFDKRSFEDIEKLYKMLTLVSIQLQMVTL
jgi:Ribosome recycling factor